MEFTKKELFDLIDGFFAYYMGASDSGIKDDRKKAKVYKFLHKNGKADLFLGEFVKERFLKDKKTITDYGLSEIRSFINWLSNDMDIDY